MCFYPFLFSLLKCSPMKFPIRHSNITKRHAMSLPIYHFGRSSMPPYSFFLRNILKITPLSRSRHIYLISHLQFFYDTMFIGVSITFEVKSFKCFRNYFLKVLWMRSMTTSCNFFVNSLMVVKIFVTLH